MDKDGEEVNLKLQLCEEFDSPYVVLRRVSALTPFEQVVKSALRAYWTTDKDKDTNTFIHETAKQLLDEAKKEIYPRLGMNVRDKVRSIIEDELNHTDGQLQIWINDATADLITARLIDAIKEKG